MDKFTFQILSLYDQRYELSISDYSDDCPYVNTHHGCPVFKEAPAEPY